jgi:hypothetical protein
VQDSARAADDITRLRQTKYVAEKIFFMAFWPVSRFVLIWSLVRDATAPTGASFEHGPFRDEVGGIVDGGGPHPAAVPLPMAHPTKSGNVPHPRTPWGCALRTAGGTAAVPVSQPRGPQRSGAAGATLRRHNRISPGIYGAGTLKHRTPPGQRPRNSGAAKCPWPLKTLTAGYVSSGHRGSDGFPLPRSRRLPLLSFTLP